MNPQGYEDRAAQPDDEHEAASRTSLEENDVDVFDSAEGSPAGPACRAGPTTRRPPAPSARVTTPATRSPADPPARCFRPSRSSSHSLGAGIGQFPQI